MLKSRTARISAILLFLFVILRLGIFGWSRKQVTEKQYERPVALKHFALTGGEIPPDWRLLADGENPRPAALSELVTELPEEIRSDLPTTGEGLLARYGRGADGKAFLLTAIFPSPEKAVEALAAFSEGRKDGAYSLRAFAFDDRLVLAAMPATTPPLALLTPLRKKLGERKATIRRIEKLKVIGNALLKILIDLLVFGFCFIVVLFLAKYVFIIRSVEGT